MAQTLTISVGLCCHVAYGTRQTVRLFPSCLCLLRDDRSKRTFVSEQQASGRLSGDLGGKGEKSRASCCGEQWCVCMAECVCVGREGGYTVAAGDSTVPAIVRKLQIDQIVEARLWAYYLGHVNVSLVSSWFTGPSECACLCVKSRSLKSQKLSFCMCVSSQTSVRMLFAQWLSTK